ncbi:MAG: DUF3857 domain-containing protein, partial [Acidobacteriota bacterium]
MSSAETTAPAVVLFQKAEVRFRDSTRDRVSTLEVWERVKVLNEEGLTYAQLVVPHDRDTRLRTLEARVVQPDGTIVEVGDDAIFREQVSKTLDDVVTKIAMPGARVGSILDVHYVVEWESLAPPFVYSFDKELPTVLSEITYHKPETLGLRYWELPTTNLPIQ